MAWQGVFFDFDGVIVDSVPVKTDAFARMFRGFGPEIEREVVTYHLAHGGVSRFAKFRYYYEELLHQPISDDELARLGRDFSRLVRQGVLEAPLIPGALESLAMLHRMRIPAFVVSGTPEDEVRHIVDTRGLGRWFTEVHGSPRLKHDIILRILSGRHLAPSACLMIGDALTDYHAATATGTCFLGIVPDGQASPFPPGTSFSSVVSIP